MIKEEAWVSIVSRKYRRGEAGPEFTFKRDERVKILLNSCIRDLNIRESETRLCSISTQNPNRVHQPSPTRKLSIYKTLAPTHEAARIHLKRGRLMKGMNAEFPFVEFMNGEKTLRCFCCC